MMLEGDEMGSRYQRDYKHEKKLAKLAKKLERLEKKKQIRELKRQLHRRPSTSKLVMWAVVVIVFQIIIWAEYEMHRLSDLSPAYSLIGITASLIPIIWGYYSKSKAENTKGGIVYDSALNDLDHDKNMVG